MLTMRQLTVNINRMIGEFTRIAQEAHRIDGQKESWAKEVENNAAKLEAARQFVIREQLPFLEDCEKKISEFTGLAPRLDHFLEKMGSFEEKRHLILLLAKSLKKVEASMPKIIELARKGSEGNAKLFLSSYEKETGLLEDAEKDMRRVLRKGHKDAVELLKPEVFHSWKRAGKPWLKLAGVAVIICLLLVTASVGTLSSGSTANYEDPTIDLCWPELDHDGNVKLHQEWVRFHELTPALMERHKEVVAIRSFKKEGAASIYAKFFDGRPSRCGLTFSHDSISCAVPIGSALFKNFYRDQRGYKKSPNMIRVTNLDNGKSVVMPVTDLGNFGYNDEKGQYNKYKDMTFVDFSDKTGKKKIERERIIDLSEAAARALGFTGQTRDNKGNLLGGLHVRIEVVAYNPF